MIYKVVRRGSNRKHGAWAQAVPAVCSLKTTNKSMDTGNPYFTVLRYTVSVVAVK